MTSMILFSGGPSVAEGAWQAFVLKILLDHLPEMLGSVLLWGILFFLAGVLLGGVFHFCIGGTGAYRLDWRHARWVRWGAALWVVAVLSLSGGAAGAGEGLLRGGRAWIEKESVRREMFLPAAQMIALYAFELDLRVREMTEGEVEPSDEEALRKAFLEGACEVDVEALRKGLARMEDELLAEVVEEAREEVRELLGITPHGWVDRLAGCVLERLVRKKFRQELGKLADRDMGNGAMGIIVSWLRGIESEARKEGGDSLISCAEFADHTADNLFRPLVLNPLRSLIRGYQITVLLSAFFLSLLPLAGFWITRKIMARKGGGETVSETPS